VAPSRFSTAVGAEVPAMIELYMLPDDILAQNPAAKFYKYTVVQDGRAGRSDQHADCRGDRLAALTARPASFPLVPAQNYSRRIERRAPPSPLEARDISYGVALFARSVTALGSTSR
jgi:hypothetical protein